jgi:hypothetical protein
MVLIQIKDLRPGDVLLYHGTALHSDLIRLFDGSEYSHAAMYDGAKVVEAVADGVCARSVRVSFKGAEYVDVYRWIGSDGKSRLGPPDYPADPIMARAHEYVGQGERYAYEEILLLALLATTRKIPPASVTPFLAAILRTMLDRAASTITTLLAAGKQPMICSELVYRCYAEADEGKYRLTIPAASVRSVLTEKGMRSPISAALAEHVAEPVSELLALQDAADDLLSNYLLSKGIRIEKMGRDLSVPVADFVTPNDLKRSPNLNPEGRIIVKRK